MDPDLRANVDYLGPLAPLKAWFFSPSYQAVKLYRASAYFRRKGLLGKVISHALWLTIVRRYGSYISPLAEIGPGLCLPHPTAVVVGEGCVLGRNVTLFQSVTLGRRNRDETSYPVLEDDVTAFAGAVLIGGIRVGRGATIGANAVVRRDVAPLAVVTVAGIREPRA